MCTSLSAQLLIINVTIRNSKYKTEEKEAIKPWKTMTQTVR